MIESEVVQVTPTTSPPCEERAQVERILADPLFSQSKRYGSFLRYVTERALRNTQEPLSERSLGIEVFGRPPNYDTDADPIVRVTASEVRKRLTQYYENPAHAGEIRVLVHKGSYVAEFVAPGAQPPIGEVSKAQSPSAAPVAEPAQKTPRRRWYLVAALSGICIVAALARVAIFLPSVHELFWAPVTRGPREVLLSVPQFSDHVRLEGVEDTQLTWTDALTPVPDKMRVSWEQYSRTLVHTWDLSVACRLSEFLGSKGKHMIVKGEHDLTMGDLRETPAVILGGLNNQWTNRLLPQARFYFDGEGSERFIRDRQNPSSRQWKFDAKVPSSNRDKDFVLISRVSDSASGRVTVLSGGFSAWGTDAAVALLTDPNQMETVLAPAPRKWDAKNVQIVLECTVVNRQAGIPRFLAAHFW
ncbi:MAG: hypothetical protein HY820_43915 [Acidobacteria bacterium]|nr:hypothetical protein [Acidobacteriota bacterium]